ncbi:hypothetical protein KIN20_007472 [Parelaphostrongylus tenuis]|uniref:Uncharacterized protein n=1 Tax=Parelaphostrongylus tenuis TaxID=148309 RepID=A0AAD5QGX7_PARTN|nr:hypothetical protein KIN20_007472 [Parelaphostrongylus tenuis]
MSREVRLYALLYVEIETSEFSFCLTTTSKQSDTECKTERISRIAVPKNVQNPMLHVQHLRLHLLLSEHLNICVVTTRKILSFVLGAVAVCLQFQKTTPKAKLTLASYAPTEASEAVDVGHAAWDSGHSRALRFLIFVQFCIPYPTVCLWLLDKTKIR